MFGGFYLWICTSVYQWWWSSTILLFCSGSTNDAIMPQISGDVAKSACTKDIYWTWTHQTCTFKKWNDPDWNANYKERSQFSEKKKKKKMVIPISPQKSCSPTANKDPSFPIFICITCQKEAWQTMQINIEVNTVLKRPDQKRSFSATTTTFLLPLPF